ncbi:MAG: HD-GYP domain-containing protein [Aquabacterium sp.]
MSATQTIDVAQLKVGMFVHLDLGWWAHPFALSSFQIASADQITTIQGLKLKQVRWSPDKSVLPEEVVAAPSGHAAGTTQTAPAADVRLTEDPAARAADQRRADLAAQRSAAQLCERQHAEAARAWKQATELLVPEPARAREAAEGLAQALVDKMLGAGDVCLRVLSEHLGDRAAAHALNVSVVALLMGRACGLRDEELTALGTGTLLHDIGKLEIPDRVRHADSLSTASEIALYRDHVIKGIAQGKRMGLGEDAMAILAQHHEMADGSGFPARASGERIAVPARIAALVNRYDNLCNPAMPSHALTPHEALSLIFAQSKSKFDAALLNAFIRLMGVYPPGSVVQLTDDRYALVVNVNAARPLKPRVLVHDPKVPADEALLLNLESEPDLGIRRSVKPAQLPAAAHDYLQPRQRMVYFFEPAPAVAVDADAEALAA